MDGETKTTVLKVSCIKKFFPKLLWFKRLNNLFQFIECLEVFLIDVRIGACCISRTIRKVKVSSNFRRRFVFERNGDFKSRTLPFQDGSYKVICFFSFLFDVEDVALKTNKGSLLTPRKFFLEIKFRGTYSYSI